MAGRKDHKGRNLHTGECQRKDGTYMYRYTDKRNGKRQTVYATDLPELRKKEKQIAKDIEDNILTDQAIKKLTLNTLFERYMETKEISDVTKVNYQKLWNHHIKDELGEMKIVQLLPSHIKTFYARMSKNGYSHSTIKLMHTLLYPTLEMALDDDMIRKNPAKNAISTDYGKTAKEKDILTLEQQKNFISYVQNSNVYHVYIPMFTIMLEIGLRCGELIGLTWNDLNMEEKVLSVNHQLIYKNLGDGCRFYAKTPKTEAGIRLIPLSHKVYNAFAQQREINFMLGRHSTEEIDGYTNFIFLAKGGRPLMPNALNNIIYNIIDAYNKYEKSEAEKEHRHAETLPKISAHSMRHTACTNMARAGMNVKVMQYIMGHANSDITMNVYNHIAGLSDVREEIAKYESVVGM